MSSSGKCWAEGSRGVGEDCEERGIGLPQYPKISKIAQPVRPHVYNWTYGKYRDRNMPVKLVRLRKDLPPQDDPTLVGQAEWCHLIPSLHLALANRSAVVEMPQIDRRMELKEACAYWETAVYLLRFLLGWRDPGTGLQWWYANNQDNLGDPRLILLEQVWNSEGQLDLLAAWFWVHGEGANSRRGEDFLERSWWDDFQRTFSEKSVYDHDPYHGGYNALHLGHSGSLPSHGSELTLDSSSGILLRSDPKKRKAGLLAAALSHSSSPMSRISISNPRYPSSNPSANSGSVFLRWEIYFSTSLILVSIQITTPLGRV